jgi:hypothetical protein
LVWGLSRGTTIRCSQIISEEDELFLDISFDSLCLNSQKVESNSLGQRSALADSDDVSFSESSECGGDVDGEGGVSLLESSVLLDVVEIISSDDTCSLHLC